MLREITQNKLYIFIILLLIWTLLGFFFVIPQYIYNVSNDQPFNWYNNLTYRVPNYMLWSLFTPVIFNMVDRLNLKKEKRIKNVLIILSAGIVISLLHRFLSIYVTFLIRQMDGQLGNSILGSLKTARFAILGGSFDSFLIYGLIVAIIVSLVYYKRHRQSELLKSQLETKLTEAKLQLLKSQLQPHFLFNTLNAVSTLMQRDVNAAEKVLSRLADLLRIFLEGLEKNTISLKEELDFLHKYLEIQKIRFDERIEIKFNTDSTLLDIAVPIFILQPVVENVIRHCVEKTSDKQQITISAQKENQNLILKVQDNGPGITDNFSKGIGLSNTCDRLYHFYGEHFDFSIKNNPDKGLTVTITIPV